MTGAVAVALAASGAVLAVAGPASATTPTGGCWVYGFTTGDDLEDTTPDFDFSSGPAAWTDTAAAPAGAADYVLTSAGSTAVGGTRTFDLTFNKGPKSAAPANGTAYYYFSVNGTNLAPIGIPMAIAAGQVQVGATVSGSYQITSPGTNTIKLRKVIYDATASNVRVACNGQTGSAASAGGGINPATTPVDTNVSNAFTAVGPTTTFSAITNQTVLTAGRAGDRITYSGTNFTTDGAGTIALCATDGTDCGATSAVTIASGAVSGQYTIPAAASTGSRALKITSGAGFSLTPVRILAAPTFTTNKIGGGAGTVVTVGGTNWDPNQTVIIAAYKAGAASASNGVVPPPGTNPSVTLTADADGVISGDFTVTNALTAQLAAFRFHAAPATVLTGVQPFQFSGDDCLAKTGAAATGDCAMLQTVNLVVTAGNLTMAKTPGDVTLSAVTLDGTEQTSTGSLQNVTVKDYRGGSLGWSLTAKFTGMTGAATIAPDKLSIAPSCTPDTNNDDTVAAGTGGAFVNSTDALGVCSVAVTGLGTDAVSGGDTAADADLELALGANQKAGAYTGTITLTLS